MFLKYFIIITFFISMALSYCALPFQINQNYMTFALIFQLILFFIIILVHHKNILQKIQSFFAHKECKILILFFLILFISSVIVMNFGGNAGIIKILLSIFFRILRIIIPLFFGYYITIIFKNKTIIKLLLASVFLILCYGFIDFIIFNFDLSFLKPLYNFFMNAHENTSEIHKTMGLPRIQGFFGEPSYFAYFIVLFLPFIYSMSFGKFKVFQNKYCNFAVKKLFPVIAVVMLLATQSPIYIVAGITVSVIYFISLYKIRKNTVYIAFGTILLVTVLLLNINLPEDFYSSNMVIERIHKTVSSLSSLTQLAEAEPSLATRIISYCNLVEIYLKNPFLGCGCGNLNETLFSQFQSTHYPLTEEIISTLTKGKTVMNGNIFFQTLAESGIISILFLYSFFFLIINRIKKTQKYAFLWDKQVLKGFYFYIIIFIIFSFYDSNMYLPYIWVTIGIIIGFCDNIRQQMICRRRTE